MNRQHRNLLSALIGLGIAAVPASPALSQQSPADFFTVRDTPLPGDTSRFDYESLDSQSHRLYVTHLGAGTIPVYDIQAGGIVGEIPDVPGVHGVLVVPELGRVYATATASNQVAVIDPQTLSVSGTIPGGVYPDGLAYDPDLGKLYVSNETGGTDTVIDTSSNQVVATIPLGGDVGNTQYDPVSHQILVAVQTRNQVIAIDPQTDQVSGRYDTPGCDHPHGLQISPDRRMAFVACEANAKLVVMDLQTMSITESHDVGTVPDVLAFDAPRRVLFVAAENGPLTALSETDTGLRPLAQRDVGPNAHAVAVDPDTGHVYVPLANFGGQPVLRELSLSTASEGGDED
ncbi:MAG: YncE family protein [Chloroflexi bacterium]|nr:MAG: YncE family protein [Chloroflexota bacterium]